MITMANKFILTVVLSVVGVILTWYLNLISLTPTQVDQMMAGPLLTALTNQPRRYSIVNETKFPDCSNEVLLEYIQRTGSFPGEGHWQGDNFSPNLCSLNNSPISSDEIRNCFRRNHIRRVATVGDSNGIRFFDALLGHIKKAYQSCELTRKEFMLEKGFRPEPAYFARDDKTLKSAITVDRRGCRSCTSRTYTCDNSDGSDTIEIEHVAMAQMKDYSIRINNSDNSHHQLSAKSYQEFLFKYYWRGRMPNLIIFFSPMCHVKNRGERSEQFKDIDYFIDLANRYVSEDSVLYWIPGFAEFESQKAKKYQNLLYDGTLATEALNRLNKHIYESVHPLLLERPARMRGFFDLLQVSLGKENWSIDGVHMKTVWYRLVTKYLLQLICS